MGNAGHHSPQKRGQVRASLDSTAIRRAFSKVGRHLPPTWLTSSPKDSVFVSSFFGMVVQGMDAYMPPTCKYVYIYMYMLVGQYVSLM